MAMKLPILTTLLLALSLLLGTSGCSKKQQDAAPATNGSYKLNGELIKCLVTAQTYSYTSGSQPIDFMDVYFTTTPQPASGEEVLTILFAKPAGQPTYQMTDIAADRCRYAAIKGRVLFNHLATAVAGSNNTYSGVFSGTANTRPGTTPQVDYYFTDGVYTNVQPHP